MRSVQRALLMLMVFSSLRCSNQDPVGSQSQSLSPTSFFYPDGKVTVVSTNPPAPPPAATCPGGALPDVCGSWQGVELTATKTYSPAVSHDAAHCFCHPIAFQIPAFLPVTRGGPGAHKAFFGYREAGGNLVSCRYDGDGAPGPGGKYLFRSCSNGAVAGAGATSDYFTLSIDMGNLPSGTTEVDLQVGAPSTPSTEQEFVSTDPRLAGAVLHVPRGAAPPFQTFSLSLADQVSVGENIGNDGDGITTVGPTVGFTADGVSGTFHFNPTTPCARVELPYDVAAMLVATNGLGPTALGARQVLDPSLVTDPNAVSLARLGADITVDTTNHTLSFCVQHLSYYVGNTSTLNAAVDSVTIQSILNRAKMAPDTPYDIVINMLNTGSGQWLANSATGLRLKYRTPADPNAVSPWRDSTGASVVNRISGPIADANQNQIGSFVTTLRSPVSPGTYEFSWCLGNDAGPPPFFGWCYDAEINVQAESCNGLDDDGDGLIDNGIVYTPNMCTTNKPGICSPGKFFCIAGNTECVQNQQPTVETCNHLDDNCDGRVDEGVTTTFYRDADGDGYGDPSATVQDCSAPQGYVAVAGDCLDSNAAVHPGATEACNGLDDNCNGSVDEGLLSTFFLDADGDGYGNSGSSVQRCTLPSGYATVGGDCNDSNGGVHPGATEVCNGIDDNCNGATDEGLLATFFRDADGDGYGNAGQSLVTCATPTPSGYVSNSNDCNDGNVSINPAAADVCNGLDDNCSGFADENTLNGGAACGIFANFTNIDDDLSIWTGDAVNGRNPNMKFGFGDTIGVSLCPLFSGCGAQKLLFKIGNGGCLNSGGHIKIYKRDGTVLFEKDRPSVFWFDCGYTYRVVVNFSPNEEGVMFSENNCTLPTDCGN